MRFRSGFCILLTLVLGLACLSQVNAYYDDDIANDSTSNNAGEDLATGTITDDTADNAAPRNPNKREFGAPNTRSDPATQTNSQETISPPVNDPATTKLSPESQSQEPRPGNQARGLGSMLSSFNGEANQQVSSSQQVLDQQTNSQESTEQQQQQQQQQKQQQQQSEDDQVPSENLPKIIENNKEIDITKQPTSTANEKSLQSKNSSMPMSTARTFDSWTNCVGSSSNKYGTCKNDIDCSKHKGRADGSCMGGLGVCCVMALSCGDKSIENNTFFANPDFPEPSWEARQCHVEVTKKHHLVSQIMIEFDEFELAPPNHDGECITDVFHIRLASNKPSPYSGLRFCGLNTGQHLYLDVSQIDEPIVLSVATSGGGFPRRWSIRIVQMDEKNFLLAPPGCLQYFTDTIGHFRSFNLGKNLKNLYYAICFRIDNGYSGIRFSSNFFGQNGPFCRKKISGPKSQHNSTFMAHPHHLVIPPAGSAYPPPKPGYIAQPEPATYSTPGYTLPAQVRYKRLADTNAAGGTGSAGSAQEPSKARTFFGAEKEAKLEEKEFERDEFKHHQHLHPQHHPTGGYSAPQVYEQPPGYQQSSYQSGYQQAQLPPPQIIYGTGYHPEPGKGGLGGEKSYHLQHDKFDHHQKPAFGIHESFGWKGKLDAKNPDYPEYPHPHGAAGYQPQPYGQQPYGPPGYGHHPHAGYHHKEIGKFGEKYEHLELKHEKNHHGKDEKHSSWWPSFWNKEDKKEKEKFFMHHEALFPLIRIPELPHCEPRYCGHNDVITFPPSGDSTAEMCGNLFNRGRGPKIVSGSPLVVYVSNRGHQRGAGFDMNYEQVFYIPKPY